MRENLAMESRKDVIIRSAARAFYVNAWANRQEEKGISLYGELMNQAPNTSREALRHARRFIKELEIVNEKSICELYAHEANKTGHRVEPCPEDFGHYLAMEALGHGVGWDDDHEDHDIVMVGADFELGYGSVSTMHVTLPQSCNVANRFVSRAKYKEIINNVKKEE